MKNSRKRINFKTGCGSLIAVLFAGSTAVSIPGSLAESNDGKNNATGGVAAVRRDPFWPVGHTPKQMENSALAGTPEIAGGIDWDKAMKKVVINGVSSRADNEYVAVINNEVKSVGESVSMQYGGARYTWTVESITPPGSVKLRRHAVE